MNNQDRAELARRALEYFHTLTRIGGPCNESVETLAVDLTCDLFHLLDEEGIARSEVLRKATYHYEEEVTDEFERDCAWNDSEEGGG